MHFQDDRNAIDAGDRGSVANEIEVELFEQCRINRIRSAGQEEGVAVRWRTHDRLGGDIAGGTRPVVDEELLTETVREPLSHQARDYVDLAPSRKADDNAHRPGRIALCPRETRHGR